ncbi:MAG TPA: VOC family protein [Hanamia sp.]|nr:VOC family protein [Hanamia sp.]
MNIPKGYQAVMPYLILKDAAGFIDFTAKVFHAQLMNKHLREDNQTVMHAEVNISGSVIMFAEATEQYPVQTANLFVYVDDADETYNVALHNAATSINEPADQPYGRSCGVKDPFGNSWWITSQVQGK